MRYTQILILGLLLAPVELMAQSANCWGNFRGDAQLTGVSSASLPDQPVLLWNFNTQDGIKAAPVSCDGIVVVGTLQGHLYGITEEGTLKWKIVTENGIEAPALIVDGVAYVETWMERFTRWTCKPGPSSGPI